ncbi:MAG: cyclic nucleotide-binding domain-containing protein [Chloroflexia bacterium]|nr:cyclic nucleotide-binding domain-containing protein [Chloroflexia bacterium]
MGVARICTPRRYKKDDVVFEEDAPGDDLYVIHKGSVEVLIWARTPEGDSRQAAINTIWQGRSFGEMVLIGGGTRSATIRCAENCLFLVINRFDFDRLCERNPRIGYRVMRNIAEDLVYKLRSSSLLLRGQVKWHGGELGGWR